MKLKPSGQFHAVTAGNKAPPRPWGTCLRAAALAASLILFLLWSLGQLARDATWLTGMCFYIPSAVMAAVLLCLTVGTFLTRHRRVTICTAGLALGPLYFLLLVENRFFDKYPEVTAELRLAHWNVGGKLAAGSRDVLLAHRADVYVLSEAGARPRLEALRSALGEGYKVWRRGDLAVIAEGNLESTEWLLDRPGAKACLVAWGRGERTVSLLIIDLPANISLHRDPLLRDVNRLIERHKPDLVVGDFNAPRRSRALSDLPAGYRHAYDTAGSGWSYTWPAPVPMYAIDQCIHSPRVIPARYELFSSIHSDHRMQVFDFSLEPRE